MVHHPFYDPEKTYEENFEQGPFGDFADGKKFDNTDKPQYSIFNLPIFLPFGIPAGPLLNGAFVIAALDKGFDIATYKTVRSHRHLSSPWPNVLGINIEGNLTLDTAEKGVIGTHEYKEPLSITNSFGVPSFEPDFWQKDMAKSAKHAKNGQFVIGSFQGTTNSSGDVNAYIQDFVDTAKLVQETGVKVMEVNLSCPNEGDNHLLCYDISRTKKIVDAIKNTIGNTPLIIKIGYYANSSQIEQLVKEVGSIVQGISAINTIPAKVFDKNGNQALPGLNRLRSGICGAPIKWAGLAMVKKLKQLREQYNTSFCIFGVGGIVSPNDYEEYRKEGADVALSATGSMWNPYLAQEIKRRK